MSQKALTQTGYSVNLPAAFNAKAKDTRETEHKFLVPEHPPGQVDLSIFQKIESYFAPWAKSTQSKILLTRQLDTYDKALLATGTTLRARAECRENNLRKVSQPDVCLKMGGHQDSTGALVRGEFEARIKDFKHVDLQPLFDKYPADQFPEVHAALSGIKSENLHEFFMIDCRRRRILVEFPEDVTGLTGKRFVGELLLDDVAFLLDKKFGLPYPVMFGRDLEIEMEPVYEACAYDLNPNAHTIVSSPLTAEEETQAMMAASREIQKASGNILMVNTVSKASRGFDYLEREVMASNLGKRMQPYQANGEKISHIQPAFRYHASGVSNDNKPHHYLNTDFGHIFRQRDVVRYAPK